MSTTQAPSTPRPDDLPDPPAVSARERHARAWRELAAAIAARGEAVDERAPVRPPAAPGELVVIGSGIETVGFSLGDEELIRGADAVFYCVADPATVVWLKALRPDAYDLYVLYDDSKVRYTTYMQMAEAMLHHVREGKRVVAVYYGHPGIFVLSTHRAIAIARREGHRAVMRAGVCALDTLCADLGVDPCHPGLQTHEATDMLIRDRRPDPRLHVVLWQVGLIGEMGFRRKGYLNGGFSVFVEYLQAIYGDTYPVTHYVASRYPTIAPTIDVHALEELHHPGTQARVTGISTFYLPPRDAAAPDREMLTRLGLLRPGQELRAGDGPLREIGAYGPRERKAFAAFAGFEVPGEYHWQEDTGASRFLIALRHDHELRARYERDPRTAVDSFPGLSRRERSLLATRDPGAIQVAAKGSHVRSARNRALLSALYRSRRLQLDLLRRLAGATPGDALERLEAWSDASGHPADWAQMRTDMALTTRDCAFAWTGIYATHGAGERLIVLTGGERRVQLAVDGEPVRRARFRRGVIEWTAIGGRQDNGFLRVDVDRRGRRRLIGSIWPRGERVPAEFSIVAEEAVPERRHPAALAGVYDRIAGGRAQRLEVGVATDAGTRARRLRVALDGHELDGPFSVAGRVLRAGERCLLLEGATPAEAAAAGADAGAPWRRRAAIAAALCGAFAVRSRVEELRVVAVTADGVTVDGVAPRSSRVVRDRVSWSGGPEHAWTGELTLVLDPLTLHPVLFGTVRSWAGETARCLGTVPVPADLVRLAPELGLSPRQWERLVGQAARGGQRPGGTLIWHQAEKCNLAATIVERVLPRLLP